MPTGVAAVVLGIALIGSGSVLSLGSRKGPVANRHHGSGYYVEIPGKPEGYLIMRPDGWKVWGQLPGEGR